MTGGAETHGRGNGLTNGHTDETLGQATGGLPGTQQTEQHGGRPPDQRLTSQGWLP